MDLWIWVGRMKYTWLNRHHDEMYTKERLDWVVANKRWLLEFNNQSIEVLTTHKSDHCPLVLNVENDGTRKLRRKIFRYKSKWALEEDGEHIIQLDWHNMNFSPNCWVNIHSKLLHCSNELVKWSASKKKISKQEIDEKIAMLKSLQLQSSPDMTAIKNLEKEIDV